MTQVNGIKNATIQVTYFFNGFVVNILFYCHTIGRAGGGVCIFIHKSIDFEERKDLIISKNDSEILSIEVTNKTKISFLVQYIGHPILV